MPNTLRMNGMSAWLLVFAQFALAALLVLSTRWWPLPWLVLLCAAPAVALAIWAWAKMGLRKIRVHPSPTDKTRLITDGPYAIVRHPMYTGLVGFTAALLLSEFAWWRLLAWTVLLIVLIAKSQYEEREMKTQFPPYAEYQQRVARLIPYLW